MDVESNATERTDSDIEVASEKSNSDEEVGKSNTEMEPKKVYGNSIVHQFLFLISKIKILVPWVLSY